MHSPFDTFRIHLPWPELVKRTVRDFMADDCLSLAAQLAFYFFLALFPALLFLLGFASFFSLSSVSDEGRQGASTIRSPGCARYYH